MKKYFYAAVIFLAIVLAPRKVSARTTTVVIKGDTVTVTHTPDKGEETQPAASVVTPTDTDLETKVISRELERDGEEE